MHFINLLPHPLDLYRFDGETVLCCFPVDPRGPFRLSEWDRNFASCWIHGAYHAGEEGGVEVVDFEPTENYCLAVPIVLRELGVGTHNLPEPKPGYCYVVSLPALMGLRAAGVDRRDIIAPDTGPGPVGAVRNEKGEVVGCRRFVALDTLPEGWAEDDMKPQDIAVFGKSWARTIPRT